MPDAGENFDVAQFQEDNDLKDPEAGIAMVVELGGVIDCEAREIEDVPIPEDSTPGGTERTSRVSNGEIVGSSEQNNDFRNNGDGLDDNDLSDDAPNSNGEFSNNTENNDGTLGGDSNDDVESIESTKGDDDSASIDAEPVGNAATPSLLKSRFVLAMAGLGLVAAIFV